MKTVKLFILLAVGLYTNVIYSQENPTKMTNPEIVQQFLAGFNDPSQIQESLALLADNYHFTNPIVELHSKAEFIGLAKEIGSVLTEAALKNSSPTYSAAIPKFTKFL
ncbi:MAG: nuclear transport factor 2 family protein [Bacteroidota bacterium]